VLLPDVKRLANRTEAYVRRRSKSAFEALRDFIMLLKQVACKKVTLPAWALFAIISVGSYILSPVDLLPDLLPLGFVDDVILAIYTLNNIKGHIRPAKE